MAFRIEFSEAAAATFQQLRDSPALANKFRRVRKTLGHLETKPRHPGLRAHRYQSKSGPNGGPVWEAYVENRTPSAWRIWFWYGPERDVITILTIGPHPD